MDCLTCNHAEHEVGECKKCNCGESEIRHFATHYYAGPFDSFDYHNNYYAWAERLSHKIRPETRARSGGGY